MAKKNELIYDVREAIRAFSDDSELDDRYIIYLYNIKRAKYLRQDLNNYQKTTDLSIQQSFCLGLQEVSAVECGVDLSCEKIMRSTQPIPKAIELHSKPAITKIKPTHRLSVPFTLIDKSRAPYIMNGPYSNAIYAFIDTDNYIYVTSNGGAYKLIDCISVTGIFEDPLSLQGYKNCCNCGDETITACFDEDESEYPLQPHYIDLIRAEIVNDMFKAQRFVEEDKDNDATDGDTKER